MLTWLSDNIGWLLILAALCALVAAIIVSMVRKRRRGGHICSGDCCSCSGCGADRASEARDR